MVLGDIKLSALIGMMRSLGQIRTGPYLRIMQKVQNMKQNIVAISRIVYTNDVAIQKRLRIMPIGNRRDLMF